MARPWTAEELAWAHECAAAGDTFEEIGAGLDCRDEEVVRRRLGVKRAMPPTHRAIAEMEAAGIDQLLIAEELLPGRPSGRKLVWSYLQTMRGWGYRIPVRRAWARRSTTRPYTSSLRAEVRERNELIEGLVGTGPSASEIARRFGTTKNAVLGVAYRYRQRQTGQAAHG